MKSIIRMNPDKSLQVISLVKTYQYEHNADELQFLLPETYGELDILNCSTILYWINSEGQGSTVSLNFESELYNETYLQTSVLLNNVFTQVTGDIEFWIEIVSAESETLLKSGIVKVPVNEHTSFDSSIPEGQLSIIDSMNIKIQQLTLDVENIYNSRPSQEDLDALFSGESSISGTTISTASTDNLIEN